MVSLCWMLCYVGSQPWAEGSGSMVGMDGAEKMLPGHGSWEICCPDGCHVHVWFGQTVT